MLSMKFGRGLKLRSRRVVQDRVVGAAKAMAPAPAEIGGSGQSPWVNLPPELLREVFARVEEDENSWPWRRSLVACAGVCRNWRQIMQEFVRTPEASGKLTFPISVKQPGPRDSLLQCFIRRNRSTQTYHLYLNLTLALADKGKFLLLARKFGRTMCTDYNISLQADDTSRGSRAYIGKLRSNFVGAKFIIYDGLPPHSGAKMMKSLSTRLMRSKQVLPRVPARNYQVAHILYELNVLGSRGPRRMQCVMDDIPAAAIEPGGVAPTQTKLTGSRIDSCPLLLMSHSKSKVSPQHEASRSKSSCRENFLHGPSTYQIDGALVLRNKAPRWHQQLQCWCLNFHGRVTVASAKNFQLVASAENGQAGPEHEKIILQFGKVGKDVFTMDYRYPLSAFQAFAICLSSFDTKIGCE
ncbi:tubby-like F-box protein 3 [Diospyros lotus]|uniref:tubby-like F-box protein 3 n=1 Tax=Diospyros lotus TaxID=55363 RepID=UPI00225B38B7|nr:tubby-like F-box protein 3 [Diospyros lotus]XP_052208445.1 tubby-like F-box protein 3 [Diospyros lotus]